MRNLSQLQDLRQTLAHADRFSFMSVHGGLEGMWVPLPMRTHLEFMPITAQRQFHIADFASVRN